jgi:5'(3')-deoxyribonucleotidase
MIRLSKHNELYIITYRNWTEFGFRDTLERVIEDEIPVKLSNIIFSKNKGTPAKELGIDLFYEDTIENIEDILKTSNSSVVVVDATYNRVDDNRFDRVKWY